MWHDIEIGWLHSVSKDRRPGYIQAVMDAANKYGPARQVRGKLYIRLSQEDKDRIQFQFNLAAPVIQSAKLKEGLGDKLHAKLGPIGRGIHWPCMKGDGTTDLKPGSPCDKARALLNQFGDKIR